MDKIVDNLNPFDFLVIFLEKRIFNGGAGEIILYRKLLNNNNKYSKNNLLPTSIPTR